MEDQPLAAQLRAKRSEMMVETLEAAALCLFELRGFSAVTVDEIAKEAQTSTRTFYRYFPAKEDVFQVAIERRSEALRVELAARPQDEQPLVSLRLALDSVLSAEDPAAVRRWISVIQATPSVLRSVMGGIQLKSQPVVGQFIGSRLGLPGDALVPTMLAAATGGVVIAAQTRWYLLGGNLADTVGESLAVLDSDFGSDQRIWDRQPQSVPGGDH